MNKTCPLPRRLRAAIYLYKHDLAFRGKISLYRQKVCVEKNIPEEQAVEKLLELIRADEESKPASGH